MSNRPQRFFLANVIFYTVIDLSTLVSDAKFALLPCHFKSGMHYDFPKEYKRVECNHVLKTKLE